MCPSSPASVRIMIIMSSLLWSISRVRLHTADLSSMGDNISTAATLTPIPFPFLRMNESCNMTIARVDVDPIP